MIEMTEIYVFIQNVTENLDILETNRLGKKRKAKKCSKFYQFIGYPNLTLL